MTETLLPLPGPDRAETAIARRNLALQSRRSLGLHDLLTRRPDIRGVSTWTEDFAESVLWSA